MCVGVGRVMCAQFCDTVSGVRGLGIRMLTLDTKTSLYTEDQGLQEPMTLDKIKLWGLNFVTRSHTS